jgi:hypothetical protein
LVTYCEKIAMDVEANRAGAVVALELDRKGDAWSQQFRYDECISLRVKGPEIFLMSVGDWSLPPCDRKMHGWLPEKLRFPLQGHRQSYTASFSSQNQSRAAAGNAYAAPMLASHLFPLVQQAVVAGVLTNPRKRPLSRDELFSLAAVREVKRRRGQDVD